MNASKFIKPEADPDLNPVDYYNQYMDWEDVFGDIGKELNGSLNGTLMTAESEHGLIEGKVYSKFQLYAKFKHKGNYESAFSEIRFRLLKHHVPYIRVGVSYYKVIETLDRWGGEHKEIVFWRKEEIKQDHGANILHKMPKFDKFIVWPDNHNHQQVIGNAYNLYSGISHKPAPVDVTEADISHSMLLMKQIFGDQLEQGMKYMKVIYDYPRQILPVLCLVSKERKTGKTTFLNWLSMIYWDNYVQLNPEDLSSNFNASYASKNIVAIDETVIEKGQAIEKIKMLSTAKTLNVNQKHVSNFPINFFGKVVLATNKVKDFMRIDMEEIRFWVRSIPTITDEITDIEKKLFEEIPMFLKYLNQMDAVDCSKTRMVFTPEEIYNADLLQVKKQSRSWMHKEILLLLREFFHMSEYETLDEIQISTTDIKKAWFPNNHSATTSYIRQVIEDEMGMTKTDKVVRYTNYLIGETIQGRQKTGTPYTFKRAVFSNEEWQRYDDDGKPVYEIADEELPF
jgi:hypothetical protein